MDWEKEHPASTARMGKRNISNIRTKLGICPRNSCSIYTDGIDSLKKNIPHFKVKSKLSQEHVEFLKTHVTGVLSHGTKFGSGIYWFIKMACWCQSHDNNILLTVLRDIVNQRLEVCLKSFIWQMDNSNWDCKNKYILGSCAFLVMAGFFKRWNYISHLLVRRTHEDVDQCHGYLHIFCFTTKWKRWDGNGVRSSGRCWAIRMVTQRKTVRHHERCASWSPNFTQTRKYKRCDTWCYGESNGSPQFTFDWSWHTKWWSSFIASEREKIVTWEEMKEHKYMEGQESFDISPFHFKPLSSDQGDEDEADVEDSGSVFKTDWMKNIVQLRRFKDPRQLVPMD